MPYDDATRTKARQMWDVMDANEKAGVRFGIFPYAVMAAAEQEGCDTAALASALMECAHNDGGMRA